MNKLKFIVPTLLLVSLILVGANCEREKKKGEEKVKTDIEVVRALMKNVAEELGWPSDTSFIKSFSDGPKFYFNNVGDLQNAELHISAEPSKPEECKIFLSGTFGEFSKFEEVKISGFTVCENITYQHFREDRKDECLSTYKGYANWMRIYIGGYEFRATGSKVCTEEYSVRSLMALLIRHIKEHHKDGKWQ